MNKQLKYNNGNCGNNNSNLWLKAISKYLDDAQSSMQSSLNTWLTRQARNRHLMSIQVHLSWVHCLCPQESLLSFSVLHAAHLCCCRLRYTNFAAHMLWWRCFLNFPVHLQKSNETSWFWHQAIQTSTKLIANWELAHKWINSVELHPLCNQIITAGCQVVLMLEPI